MIPLFIKITKFYDIHSLISLLNVGKDKINYDD